MPKTIKFNLKRDSANENFARFTVFRKADISATHDANQANPADKPQLEGVQFSDGTVVVRWLTAKHSTSIWDSIDTFLAIHGHPEYDTELVWHD
jgi:hypothetical protein